jgi:hypothetical protein
MSTLATPTAASVEAPRKRTPLPRPGTRRVGDAATERAGGRGDEGKRQAPEIAPADSWSFVVSSAVAQPLAVTDQHFAWVEAQRRYEKSRRSGGIARGDRLELGLLLLEIRRRTPQRAWLPTLQLKKINRKTALRALNDACEHLGIAGADREKLVGKPRGLRTTEHAPARLGHVVPNGAAGKPNTSQPFWDTPVPYGAAGKPNTSQPFWDTPVPYDPGTRGPALPPRAAEPTAGTAGAINVAPKGGGALNEGGAGDQQEAAAKRATLGPGESACRDESEQTSVQTSRLAEVDATNERPAAVLGSLPRALGGSDAVSRRGDGRRDAGEDKAVAGGGTPEGVKPQGARAKLKLSHDANQLSLAPLFEAAERGQELMRRLFERIRGGGVVDLDRVLNINRELEQLVA